MNMGQDPRRWLIRVSGVVILGLLAVGMATFVNAHGGDSSKIHACVNNASGTLRIVAASESCRNGETPLDWNIAGPPGLQGPAGAPGVTGLEVVSATSGPNTDPIVIYIQGPEGPYPIYSTNYFHSQSVNCPGGKLAVSGGVRFADGNGNLRDGMVMGSFPIGNPPTGWSAVGSSAFLTQGGNGKPDRITVFALCAKVAP